MIRRTLALVCSLWFAGAALAQNAPGGGWPMSPVNGPEGVTPFKAIGGTASLPQSIRSGYALTVADFGTIDPTGVADSSAAFIAAASSGTCVSVPPGKYLLNSASLSSTNQNMCLAGMSSVNTQLIFAGAGGVSFITNAINYMSVSHIRMTASAAAAGTAISANWTSTAGLSQQMANIDDVILDQSGSGYWTNGVIGTNIANAVIHNFDMHGPSPAIGVAFNSQKCLQFLGTSIDVMLTDIHCTSVDTGIDDEATTQGLYVKGFAGVDVNTGIVSNHLLASSSQPLINVVNFHINARSTAVKLYGGLQSFLSSGLIYASPNTNAGWTGISVDGDAGAGSQDITVRGVQLNSALAASATSVTFIDLGRVARFDADVSMFGVLALAATTGVHCSVNATTSYVRVSPQNVKVLYANDLSIGAVNCLLGIKDGTRETLASPAGAVNASPAISINKAVEFDLFGADANGTLKAALMIKAAPANSNYTTATTTVSGRNSDANVPLWAYGPNYNQSLVPILDGTCGTAVVLTTAGETVPAGISCRRYKPTGMVATATITLPTALGDGQVLTLDLYSFNVTALTFSPAVTGWTDLSTWTAPASLRLRWDATGSVWFREQ